MRRFEFRSLEFARNPENEAANVYHCELGDDAIKVAAGTLPSLEINAKLKDFVEVYVSHVESPAKFHVQLKENDVSELQRKMILVYASPSALKPLANPQRGQYCAIKNDKDNVWYRAVVVNRASPTQADVYLVDYGSREKVLMTNLKELHPECSLLPPQAIECKLQDVEEKDNAETTQKFRDLVHLKTMVLRLNGMEGSALLVTLYQVVGNSDFNVNDYLLGKGPAPPLSNSDLTSPTALPIQADIAALEASPVSRNATSQAQAQASGNAFRSENGGHDLHRGGRFGGNSENRGSGFGDRGNFRGNREFGGRGNYGGNRGSGGFGDRNNNRFSNDDSERSGAFGGEENSSGNRFRGRGGSGGSFTSRGAGYSGFGCGGSRAGGSSTFSSSSNHDGMTSPIGTISGINAKSNKAELLRPAIKVNDSFVGKVIQPKSPFEFWITTALVSGFNKLPDAMWNFSKDKGGGGFTRLQNASVGSSCIMLAEAPAVDHYPIYCRAVITQWGESTCDLWLVDYAETKYDQPTMTLYEIPSQFTELLWQAIKCKLDQAEEIRGQFADEMKVKMFVDGINHADVNAMVKGLDGDVAVVQVQVGPEKRDLLEICKNIASGVTNAFGIREGM